MKKTKVEQFLAAPETLLRSKEERQKAINRKAAEEAKQKRLLASKRPGRPSMEDLLADIIRVAEDPETNPQWHKFRAISRRRYELFGWYPVEYVDAEFGMFEHAKAVAGLAEQFGTRLKKGARTWASRREHAARYLVRHVHPYVAKWPDLALREPKLLLSISDTHSGFLNPFVWSCFLRAIRDLGPDIVYLNGDVIDGSEITRHPIIPGWTMKLQDELDFAREMLVQVRAVHQGKIVFGAGNHCLDRMAMYLTQVAEKIANLRTLRFDRLLDLDGLGVDLAMGGTIASPVVDEHAQRGRLLYGFYRVYHGSKTGKTPALDELDEAGRSGQSGHVHRAGLAFGTTEAMRAFSWMSTPMGCTPRAGRAYIKGPSDGWQQGFGIAWLYPDGAVHQYPVVVDRGVCHVEGFTYRSTGQGEPDPSTVWIRGFRP